MKRQLLVYLRALHLSQLIRTYVRTPKGEAALFSQKYKKALNLSYARNKSRNVTHGFHALSYYINQSINQLPIGWSKTHTFLSGNNFRQKRSWNKFVEETSLELAMHDKLGIFF